jgi:hypothetical protein
VAVLKETGKDGKGDEYFGGYIHAGVFTVTKRS